MESFGVFIKGEREKKGIRLEEIASITKIHLHTLEMLEEGNWEKLPPEPFIRGFITAYGKYVGLDTRDLIQRYAEEVGEQRTDEPENLTPPQDVHQGNRSPGQIIENSGPFPMRKIASGLGMVGVLALLFTVVYLGKQASESASEGVTQVTSVAPESSETEPSATTDSETTEATKVAENDSVLPKPSERGTTAAAPAKAKAPVEAKPKATSQRQAHKVVIQGKESTWVKVSIDDSLPVESFLNEGESATFEAEEKIRVTLGNSTGAVVKHNGKSAPGKQFLGTIRTYQFPENASFPKDRNPSSPSASTRRD